MSRAELLLALGLCAGGLCACGGGGSSSGGTAASTPGATVTSEADAILHLDKLRAMGFRGANVKVGVISTGVVNLASYQTAGTLPTGIYISQNRVGTLDEGDWIMELVHQHAPDAALGFCDGEDLDFDGCIKDLIDNFHADVLVDDLLFSGQFYPDATADIVNSRQAANDRLVFIHLAGNEQNGGYWQGSFASAAGSIGGGPKTLLDFGTASNKAGDTFNAVSVPAGKRLALLLNWNDPPHTPANRALSAYLLDSNGQILTQASGQTEPNLVLDYTNATAQSQTVRLAVSLDAGSAVGLAVQVTEGSRTCNIECQALTYSTAGLAGGTVGDFDGALVVGATDAHAPRVLEAWSNAGPFRIEFAAAADNAAPDGYDYTRLAHPLLVQKPDLVAPDCVTTPFSNGAALANQQFCGTSAAVPSIAGAAALLESAGFNRAQVMKALRGTAVPLGAAGWSPGSGFGLADAAAAYASGGT